MIRSIPPGVMYLLFAVALVIATFPLWRLAVFGFHPTLDQLLQLRCFGA